MKPSPDYSAPNLRAPDEGAPETGLSVVDTRREFEPVNNASSYANSPLFNTQEAENFDIHRLIAVVLRRWPVMLGVLAAALAIGFISIKLTKPIYQSVAKIELTTPQRGGAGGAAVPGLEIFTESAQSSSIDTQIETLRDNSLHDRALKTLAPRDKAVLKEFAPVGVIQVGTTNLIAVAAQSYEPKAAAMLSNAVCREFIAGSLQKNRANSHGAVRYVEEQLRVVQQNLARAQARVKENKEKNGIYSISSEAENLSTKLAGLQSSVESATSERAALSAKLNGVQSLLSQLPANRVVPNGIQRNPVVANLQNQLTQLELRRTVALKDYTPNSYLVKSIDTEIDALRARLKKEAQTLVSGWQPDPRRAPLASDAAATQTQIWSMDARIVALKQQTEQARVALSRLPSQELRAAQLDTDQKVLQQTYETLNQQLQSLKIGEEAKVADARIVSLAEPILKPIAPERLKLMLYAGVLGLLGAFATALVLDMLDNRIYSDEEAQRITGLPVLSHVPFSRVTSEVSLMPKPSANGQSAQLGRTSPLLESFRMLRANIAFSAVDKPIRALVVTSSVPNEGKSNSAFNLAVAAAIDGERVVLVDLDLRRPTAHTICELPNRIGFSSVALGRATLEEALQESGVPGLRILTSGPTPPNPFKMLNSQSARAIIDELRKDADFIVIDTPPMLGMADARLVASWVDGTLLIVSCRDAARREVGRAADLLAQGGTETLGVVLTKVPTGSDGYYGYGYYGYRQYGDYMEGGESQTKGKKKKALKAK